MAKQFQQSDRNPKTQDTLLTDAHLQSLSYFANLTLAALCCAATFPCFSCDAAKELFAIYRCWQMKTQKR